MGCGCGGGRRSTSSNERFEVVVTNSGGQRATPYRTADAARSAARAAGGDAYRIDGAGRRTKL